MVSRNDKREIFVAGTYHYPDLKAPLEAVAKRAPITVLFGHDKPVAIAGGVEDWTNQSDHGPFHAAKIPFVYFGVEDHADYHKPTIPRTRSIAASSSMSRKRSWMRSLR